MDHLKKTLLATCGLVLASLSWGQDFPKEKLGEITQSVGQVTYLSFKGPEDVQEVKTKSALYTAGSYLTREDSFITAKLFEGSFLRASPKTKFSMEIDKTQKTVTLHLFTGSLKILISNAMNKGEILKLIIKSADVQLEASEAKFSVIRNPVMSDVGLYVEKGTVSAFRIEKSAPESIQIVHGMESLIIDDKSSTLASPSKISSKELKKLHAKFYLKPLIKTATH